MPPGHEPIPSAHTSVPGLGQLGQPGEDDVEEDHALHEHVELRVATVAPTSASGSKVWGGTSPDRARTRLRDAVRKDRGPSRALTAERSWAAGGSACRWSTAPCCATAAPAGSPRWCCTTRTPVGSRPSHCVLGQLGGRARRPSAVVTTDDLDTALTAPTSSSRRSGSAVWPAAPVTSGSPSTSGCSARRRPARVALAYGAAHRAGGRRHRRADRRGSPRTRGSSTSPTRPAWSPRRCSRCSATGSSASATRRSGWPPGGRRARPRPGRPPRSTTSGSTTSAGCARLRVDGVDRLPAAAGRPGGTAAARGGPAVRRRVAAHAGRPAQRVPLLLLLHPRGGGLDPRGAADPRRVPPRPAGGLLRRPWPATPSGPPPSGAAVRARARRHLHARERAAEGEERDAADVAGGGYEGVALAIMAAISRGERLDDDPQRPQRLRGAGPARGRRRRGAVHGRRGRARGRRPCRRRGPPLGTMQQVKAVERAVIEAATTGSRGCALRAFALHPLVDSVSTARRLLAGYRAASPEVDALLS